MGQTPACESPTSGNSLQSFPSGPSEEPLTESGLQSRNPRMEVGLLQQRRLHLWSIQAHAPPPGLSSLTPPRSQALTTGPKLCSWQRPTPAPRSVLVAVASKEIAPKFRRWMQLLHFAHSLWVRFWDTSAVFSWSCSCCSQIQVRTVVVWELDQPGCDNAESQCSQQEHCRASS